MLLLDLFCGAGGASVGYARAGFTVVGVDLAPQKNYPFAFIQHDATTLDQRFLKLFDAIHASPPCQFATAMTAPGHDKSKHLNLIPATRKMLVASGKPYVIENVEGAKDHLQLPITLCGSMFMLGAQVGETFYQLQRHRLFEVNWPIRLPDSPCQHTSPVVGVYGGHARVRSAKHGGRGTRDAWPNGHGPVMREAMGIDWPCSLNEISEGIPPAYSHWIGRQLLAYMAARP